MVFHPLAGAQLYLDPGSGSLIIQVLLAVILGAGVAIKVYWRKLKALLGKKDADDALSAEDEMESDSEQQ
ncbi:MAG: hypothetical protein KA988_06515 [Longilinea sp.]|nr:hypothetical protein [Longilinea sp.]